MAYKHVKKIIFTVLALHVCIAFFLKLVLGVNNLHPFFSWEFFSYVPQSGYVYTIEVNQVGERTFVPPLAFSETRKLAEAVNLDSTNYYYVARDLGEAVGMGNREKERQLARQMASLFAGQSYKYNVVRVYHDPIEYWKTQTYTDKTIIKSFTSNNENL